MPGARRRRKGQTQVGANAEVHADKRKAGNGKAKYGDEHGMERHTGFRGKPGWQGKGRKLEWGA